VHPLKGSMDLKGAPDLLHAVTDIVSRHPVQQRELQKAIEECYAGESEKALEVMQEMLATGRFKLVDHNGEPYWVIREGRE
jgi:hypothetical protein